MPFSTVKAGFERLADIQQVLEFLAELESNAPGLLGSYL
jgi:hypothetical protein